jgi:hypothetical protein
MVRVIIDISVAGNTDHSGRAVYGTKYIRPPRHWDCGFETHSRNGCLSAFLLCLRCPVYLEALRQD